MHYKTIIITLLTIGLALPAAAQSRKELKEGRKHDWQPEQVQRWVDYQSSRPLVQGARMNCLAEITSRRDAILNGNRITTQILNFGSISSPGNTITDIVWNGLGYGFEFGPFVAAEIEDPGRRDPQSVPLFDDAGNPRVDQNGNPLYGIHVVSDGLVSNGGEVSPDGSEFWGWQPIPCAEPVGAFGGLDVVERTSPFIPTSDARDTDLDGKPDSWPATWFNDNLQTYLWPGALRQGASNADKEALYFMNDYNNNEFVYYPFSSDSTKRGLGLEVETRIYQWANPLAEDAMFLIYKITNKSEKDLDKVIFGMWGDPHIGGPGDWPDDLARFDKDLNMVFAWDADGRSDIPGRTPGYFGYKFLESPGIGNEIINGASFPGDGIDNDNDGMIDESWTDGIDNDGDWDPSFDDVGIDGIPGTGDQGEGDGIPTAGSQFDITKPGETNFEFTDIDESDQIGLTSFASPGFAGNRISNDERVWTQVQPGNFEEVPTQPGDYVFLYGSGSFPLRAGETKRFSIALIVGESFDDLVLNAETVQQIFDVGYRFARPPNKPRLTGVAGDKKVTLYWDADAESSVDPLSREQDFEGYAIYRSSDHEFSDQQTITDINGSKFLFRPLTNSVGVEAKFDLDNGIAGPSPIPFPKRGVSYDLGDDTGLFHTYVDSNNVINGQTYYYSVVAYDRGWNGGDNEAFLNGIPPSETSKTITFNPVTDDYIFDDNTVSATPSPTVAGYVAPSFNEGSNVVQRVSGKGTGPINLKIIDALAVPDDGRYTLRFDQENGQTTYSLTDERPKTVTFAATAGKSNNLGVKNIIASSFQLSTSSGTMLTAGTDYTLNAESGSVLLNANDQAELVASFTYQPVMQSSRLGNEESNPVFDGLHLFIDEDPLGIDTLQTGWSQGGNNIPFEVRVATSGPGRVAQPNDYEIVFSNQAVSTSFVTNLPLPFEIFNLSMSNEVLLAFVPDLNRDGAWNINEQVIILETVNGEQVASWQVDFEDIGAMPAGGDVFFIKTTKPFDANDAFTINTIAANADPAKALADLRDVYVVPNPYVASSSFEPTNPVNRAERGDRRLYFANVPQRCTIRIYTIAGELVDTIFHDSILTDGKAFWDLRTKDNMNIAYGLYIFQVESEEGAFIGKFAVIK